MIGNLGFAAAAFARDIAVILVVAVVFIALAMTLGLGTFLLLEAVFGSVT